MPTFYRICFIRFEYLIYLAMVSPLMSFWLVDFVTIEPFNTINMLEYKKTNTINKLAMVSWFYENLFFPDNSRVNTDRIVHNSRLLFEKQHACAKRLWLHKVKGQIFIVLCAVQLIAPNLLRKRIKPNFEDCKKKNVQAKMFKIASKQSNTRWLLYKLKIIAIHCANQQINL